MIINFLRAIWLQSVKPQTIASRLPHKVRHGALGLRAYPVWTLLHRQIDEVAVVTLVNIVAMRGRGLEFCGHQPAFLKGV